jgi:predicted TIM-barrel fold metal-dependent hydrolase
MTGDRKSSEDQANPAESQPMPAIDVHGHYGAYTDGKSELGDWCMSASADEVASRARQMNVQWTIVSPLLGLLPRFGADAAEGNTEASKLIAATPGLLQWVIINPLQPKTYEQAEQMLQDSWCVGVKIHPEEHGYSIVERGREIFEFCAARRTVILTHTGEANSMPDDFLPFANEFPEVSLILAHIGCSSDGEPGRQVRAIQRSRHGNVYADTSSARSIMPRLIEWAVREAGVEQILFGSDTPLYDLAMQRTRIDTAALTEIQKSRILRENAYKLLQLHRVCRSRRVYPDGRKVNDHERSF